MFDKEPMTILLKLSGEVLKGGRENGICKKTLNRLASTVKAYHDQGVRIGIVIGGGNILRGANADLPGLDRSPADQMGLLATMINGIALKAAIENVGCKVRVLSALECPRAVEAYNWEKAHQALEGGEVLIFVGGTGNPYFTTDSAAALRACEIKADLLIKGTKVDGVYSDDPMKNRQAKRFDELTFTQVLDEDLKVMDGTAIALCRDNDLPILVCKMDHFFSGKYTDPKSLIQDGTLVKGGNV